MSKKCADTQEDYCNPPPTLRLINALICVTLTACMQDTSKTRQIFKLNTSQTQVKKKNIIIITKKIKFIIKLGVARLTTRYCQERSYQANCNSKTKQKKSTRIYVAFSVFYMYMYMQKV